MKNFSQNFLQKLLLTLFLGLFLGGCEVAPVPAAYLQYLLGNKTGVVTVDDISIIDDGIPTMRFTINDSKATSATVYTLDSTNTLAFVEGAYSTHSNGDYTYAIYEGSNAKLWLADFDNKGGVYKLYSNGVLIDEGNFVWWIGDINLDPEPDPEPQTKQFLDYFDDGETYGDENYEFVYADSTLGGYIYDEDSCTVDGTLTGTFGYDDLEDGQWGTYLIATVNTTDETISIETITSTDPTVPSETLLGYLQKDPSYTKTLWCKENNKLGEDDIYSMLLKFTDDGKVEYDFVYETVLADPKIIESYSGIYYTTGTDTSATFKGVVDDESITVHLTEINGNTMKHVMYKGDSTEKYYEVTLEYFSGA